MTEKRKRGNGREEVKEYVLGRLRERPHPNDPFVRIVGEEIAAALGISPQMVNTHVRLLVRCGVFHRERRCFYRETGPGDSPPTCAAVSFIPQPFSGHVEEPVSRLVSLPAASVHPSVPTAESFMVPEEDILGTFIDVSGKRYFVFRNFREVSRTESGNIRTSFPQVSETREPCFPETFRNVSETSDDSKKEFQEIKEKIKKEKSVEFLGEWVDSTSEDYLKAHDYAVKLFNKHGAGVRKGTNPKLINRFVAGFILKIPLINFPELEDQLKQAEQETAQYESYKGFGKQSGIRRPYIRIASYLKKCYEAAGWTWTKLNTPFESRLKKAHQQPKVAPVLPQIRVEQEAAKPVPGSVLSVPTETQIAEAESPAPNFGKKLIPVDIDRIIERSGIGKIPPVMRPPKPDP